MPTPLLKKLGVRPGTRSILIQAPPEAVQAIGLPGGEAAARLTGAFGYIHLFVTSRADLDARFPRLKRHLQAGGALWVSWPKGKGLGTDLTLQRIIAIGYGHGLVESKTISIDPTWSAIKFTFPKPGKTYENSYGQLGKRSR